MLKFYNDFGSFLLQESEPILFSDSEEIYFKRTPYKNFKWNLCDSRYDSVPNQCVVNVKLNY